MNSQNTAHHGQAMAVYCHGEYFGEIDHVITKLYVFIKALPLSLCPRLALCIQQCLLAHSPWCFWNREVPGMLGSGCSGSHSQRLEPTGPGGSQVYPCRGPARWSATKYCQNTSLCSTGVISNKVMPSKEIHIIFSCHTIDMTSFEY